MLFYIIWKKLALDMALEWMWNVVFNRGNKAPYSRMKKSGREEYSLLLFLWKVIFSWNT